MSESSPYIGFIVHGHPARRRRFEKALHNCRQELAGLSYRVMYTKPGMIATDARNLADENCTHIIAAGGDGTISDVVHGILSSDNPDVIAGQLPQGTANDWSKTWPAAPSLKQLLELIKSGVTRQSDVGCMELSNGELRYFLNIADLGIGAQVVERVNRRSKWMGANLTFLMSILQTFITYRNIAVTCKADKWEWKGKIKSIVVANGRYFGSGLGIAPDASPSDGLLDLVIVGDVSMADYVKYLPDLKKAKKISHPGVIYKTARSLVINAPENAGIEADGELFGHGTVTIRILPKGIRLLEPFKKHGAH